MHISDYDFRDQPPAWSRYAINTSPGHDKYYETRIDMADDGTFVLTKRWGRRPDTGKGQTKVELFQSMSTAMGVADAQLANKLRGGYDLTERPASADGQVEVETVSHWMPDGAAQCGPCFNGTRVGVCDERHCQCGCRD